MTPSAQVASGGVSNALVQRVDWPWNWGGGQEEEALPEFTYGSFISGNPNFDLVYEPKGPIPEIGEIAITVKVFVDFKDFSRDLEGADGKKPFRNVRLTRKQRADTNWRPDERREFSTNLRASIESGWSGKHDFELNEADFSHYRAAMCLRVQVVSDASDAHHTIQANKIPEGLSFRSFHSGSSDTAVLADEDVDQETRLVDIEPDLFARVGPFETNSAALTPPLDGDVDRIGATLKSMQDARTRAVGKGSRAGLGVMLTGRASNSGPKSHNQKLGSRRVDSVAQRLQKTASPTSLGMASEGEDGATDSMDFQRVDVAGTVVDDPSDPDFAEQKPTTAAHEAGHMFGLGDEYEDAERSAGGSEGDRPSHYDKVKELMGEDVAETTLVNDDESIMSEGTTVLPAHYVYFLEVLNVATDKKWSVVDAGGPGCAPTPRTGLVDREAPDGTRPAP